MVCEEEYELLEQIGRGSYGKVYRAQHDSGEVHAIKVVELEAAEDDLDNIQQEIKMLQAFNCPQLTRYHGSFIVGSSLWISMEYLEGGSLQELIKSSKTNLDEHTTQWVLREILKALVYLHTERKIHRDVKAGNILVASDGSVRLADFGESVQLTHSIAKRQTFAGSPYWMAPEVIMAQDTYNSKADIWSLGVTAIEMIKGRPPYSEMHPMKAVLCIPNNPPPTLGKDGHYSKHFHTFLEQCFQRDPNLRPSAQDLLRHPFMKAAKPTDALGKLLEARRAAEMMKNLFGGREGGGLLSSTAPPLDATHKAKTTLPASAAAAIAAAQAAAGNGARGSNALDSSFDPKTASVEWDFGDGDEDGDGDADGEGDGNGDDGFTQAANHAAAGLGEFDLRSPKQASGEGTGGVSPGGGLSPPSPGAVTPKARGGSGGMWLDHTPEADKGSAADTLKGPPPLAERQRRRGKMAKVGHLLGIDDAAGAATLQAEMTVLARQQEEELVRRQKAAGLGSWSSSKSGAATPTTKKDSTDFRNLSIASSLSSSQPRRVSSSLYGKGGGRNASCSSGSAWPTSSSTATAALTPAHASSSQEMAMMTHGSSLSSASAATSRGGSYGDGAKSGSMFGRLVRRTARENGVSSSTDGAGGGGGGVDTARPHAASHDLTAQDGGAPQAAAAAAQSRELHREAVGEAMSQVARDSKLVETGGRGDSASGGVEPSKQPSLDISCLEAGGGGGSDQVESRPSTANPRPLSSASDSVSWPALPPMRWAADEDGDEAPRNQIDEGDGVTDEGKAAAMRGVKTEVAEPPLPLPAPLRTRRSWEQDDVGDLIEDDDDVGGRSELGGVASARVEEREGDRSAATIAEDEQQRQNEATSGVDSGSKEAMSAQADLSALRQEAEGEGIVQAAEESGTLQPTSTPNTKSREGGAFNATETTGQLSLPPLSPAVAVPAAAASAPESGGGSSALGGGSAAEMSGPHIASQSSLTMPWGTCGFGNISESPDDDSVKSTAGVLGVGTSETTRDIGEGGVVVDEGDWNSVGSEAQEADVEKRGEGGEVVGVSVSVERGDNSDADFTSSEHDNQSQQGSEVPASPTSATRETLDNESAAATGAVALEDGAAVVNEETEAAGAAAVPRDGEEEDRLTAAFHAHLTPALCELWDATEDGSAQRQAVQDLAMALERLDGCGNGELTLDFVGAVAKSWPAAEAGTADDTLPCTG